MRRYIVLNCFCTLTRASLGAFLKSRSKIEWVLNPNTTTKAERYSYPAVFTYEPGREISVFFPDLDAATSGINDDDALLSARELLGLVLYGREVDCEPIPLPSALAEIQAAKNERTALIDVYMPSIRMAQVNRSVNRTVTIPAWLNAAAREKGINFSQALQAMLMNELGISR